MKEKKNVLIFRRPKRKGWLKPAKKMSTGGACPWGGRETAN